MLVARKEVTLQAKTQPVAFLRLKNALEILSEAKGDGETRKLPAVQAMSPQPSSDLPRSMCFGGRLWRRLDAEAKSV